jgi:hypothetical protein
MTVVGLGGSFAAQVDLRELAEVVGAAHRFAA